MIILPVDIWRRGVIEGCCGLVSKLVYMSVGRKYISSVLVCIKDHAIILPIVIFQCGHADTSIIVVLIDKTKVCTICMSLNTICLLFWQLILSGLKDPNEWCSGHSSIDTKTHSSLSTEQLNSMLFYTNSTVTVRLHGPSPAEPQYNAVLFFIQMNKKGCRNVQNWEVLWQSAQGFSPILQSQSEGICSKFTTKHSSPVVLKLFTVSATKYHVLPSNYPWSKSNQSSTRSKKI